MPRPSRPSIRTSVGACIDVSKNMRRITLSAPELKTFPRGCAGSYIKLLLPSENSRPYIRTYTIRHFRPGRGEIDVDFVLHRGFAPAANWAAAAKCGDTIDIKGPGPGKMVDPSADWFLLAADMTALPALSADLENLDSNARGYAVVEIMDEGDRQDLTVPHGVELAWVVNATPGSDHSPLLEQVNALAWREGRVSIWAACEFKTMRKLRSYFRQERNVDRRDLYISSYWKQGISEDQHKREKRIDAEVNDD